MEARGKVALVPMVAIEAVIIKDSKTTETFSHLTLRISRMRPLEASRTMGSKTQARTFLKTICSRISLISNQLWLKTITRSMIKVCSITSKIIINLQPCRQVVTFRPRNLYRLLRIIYRLVFRILKVERSQLRIRVVFIY
jgi:hypothetical protein